MDNPPEVELVLPCLDEATGLSWLLPRVPLGIRVILADNGSTDESVQVARDHGATIIDVPQRGYGAACHAGLLAARAEIVAVMDADGSLDPAQLGRVLEPVREGRLDLVVGARSVHRGAQPWHLRFANRALVARLARRTGVRLHDLGPVRAARRTGLLALDLQDRRSGYPAETVVKAADSGWRIGEVWVDYRVRSGRSKVTGTARGLIQAITDMSAALNRPAG